ncbi:MAG: ferrous iron transporter B [Elusimicrobia bacterium]|nr:ferrous iron transporter B [Elusimicrobiota bacterium]
MRRILLVGNPNVGKSAIFSHLTGINVITSNYPGTTVEFTRGYLLIKGGKFEIIDIPGTYTLEPCSKAEKVAVDMISNEGGDAIINVVDATNLERNLGLTLQLLKQNAPVIAALNFWDETKHLGIRIDAKGLENILGAPVVPTCGLTGEGIKELVERLPFTKSKTYDYKEEEKWLEIGGIVSRVQKLSHRHHTFLDKLEEISTHPLTGIPFALLILFLTFKTVRFIGEGLINYILDPLFNKLYYPLIVNAVNTILPVKFLQDILLGTTPKVMESFGLLTTGIYIPLAVVLPYIAAFYLILSALEDIGYLPRAAVLLDFLFHKMGLHGYASIPVILGFGCKVPAILSLRILESDREKIIAAVLILMMAPCIPQTAMIMSLIAPHGTGCLLAIFLLLFLISVSTSFALNKLIKGETPELFLEIPPYRMPHVPTLAKKLWIRLKAYFMEAAPMIILGVFIVGVLDALGVTDFMARSLGRPVVSILGLPEETISVMLLGFLRKDVSIALLAPFDLNAKQLVVASVFMVLYLPCIATFFTLSKESGIKNALKIVSLMLFTAVLAGALLNLLHY